MKCLRGKISEHRVSRRRHSGGPFGTLDKSFAAGGLANLSLPFWPRGCHKTRMDKHSRAFSRLGKRKSKRLSAVGRKPLSRRQVIPDQWVELATDAIRDGHTTVDSFVALFHPEVRFTAFRAYIAAMVTFTAKVATLAPSARPSGRRRITGSRKLG
jgi:hypothetical protein